MAAPLALGLALLAGCGQDTGGTLAGPQDETIQAPSNPEGAAPAAFTESEADTRAAYTLRDYRFEGPATVKGPKVFFTAENEGSEPHELEILDASGEAVGEIEAFAPGASAAPLALVLQPGTYTLQCILETSGGQVHKELGMQARLTVE